MAASLILTPENLFQFLTDLSEKTFDDLDHESHKMPFSNMLCQVVDACTSGHASVFTKKPGWVFSDECLDGKCCVTMTQDSAGTFHEETRHVLQPGDFLVADSEEDVKSGLFITDTEVRGKVWAVSFDKAQQLYEDPQTNLPPQIGYKGSVLKKGWGILAPCARMGYTHHDRPASWGEGSDPELNDYIVIQGACGEKGASEAYCVPAGNIEESFNLEPFVYSGHVQLTGLMRTASC
jgi:uncharacterized Fe-S cluster protein YjdI